MAGCSEMLRRIEPEKIVCYNMPFPEMQGNIIYVDYERSSWRYMNYERGFQKEDLESFNIISTRVAHQVLPNQIIFQLTGRPEYESYHPENKIHRFLLPFGLRAWLVLVNASTAMDTLRLCQECGK